MITVYSVIIDLETEVFLVFYSVTTELMKRVLKVLFCDWDFVINDVG